MYVVIVLKIVASCCLCIIRPAGLFERDLHVAELTLTLGICVICDCFTRCLWCLHCNSVDLVLNWLFL